MKQISFRLKPGEFLKESVEKMATNQGIKAGVLLSIVGGLDHTVLRMAGSEPDHQIIKEWPGPFEIVAGTGTLSQHGCHIHVALSGQDGQVIGGHLKDHCVVKYTAEIVFGIFDDVSYERLPDEQTGFDELHIISLK